MTGKKSTFGSHLLLRAPAVLYLAWLFAYFWLLEDGRYKALLQANFWPLLVMGMIFVGLFIYSQMVRTAGHGSHRGNVLLCLTMLALPLLFLWATYGETLGSRALSMKALSRKIEDFTDSPTPAASGATGAVLKTNLKELTEGAQHFRGRRVEIEGQVSITGMPDNVFQIFRFQMICCAACATPLWAVVRGQGLEDLKDNDWVSVTGLFEMQEIEGEPLPVIKASKIEKRPLPPASERYLE